MKRKVFPYRNELVVGTVKLVEEHGVTLELNEYEGLEAYVPRSHIRSGRVRDIRDFAKEGQRVVGRVIRVNKQKELVDVSLRYVSRDQSRTRLAEWKERVRVISLVKMAAKKLGEDPDELGIEVWDKLANYYERPIDALIEAMRVGPEPLTKAEIEEGLAGQLVEEANTHLTPPIYVRSISFKLVSFSSDGVNDVKEALTAGEKAVEGEGVGLELFSIGAPKYVVKVSSTDPKAVRKAAKSVVDEITGVLIKKGGAAEVTQERGYKRRAAA